MDVVLGLDVCNPASELLDPVRPKLQGLLGGEKNVEWLREGIGNQQQSWQVDQRFEHDGRIKGVLGVCAVVLTLKAAQGFTYD